MKKSILITITILLALTFTACSGNTDSTTQSENPSVTSGETEQPLSSMLLFGTFLLEETEYAVSPELAGELLPLWKAVRSLTDSENVSAEEMDAVFNQIEDTMTEEQMTAIKAMDMTQVSMSELFEQFGIEFGGGRLGGGEVTEEMRATMQASRESGDTSGRPEGFVPGSGMGGGQGGGLGGAELSPEARETAMAERDGTRLNTGLNPNLLNALIELLETRSQE